MSIERNTLHDPKRGDIFYRATDMARFVVMRVYADELILKSLDVKISNTIAINRKGLAKKFEAHENRFGYTEQMATLHVYLRHSDLMSTVGLTVEDTGSPDGLYYKPTINGSTSPSLLARDLRQIADALDRIQGHPKTLKEAADALGVEAAL